MSIYIILNKPFGYLSQFQDEGKFKGLKHLLDVPNDVYAVGRLDATSEGLLLLTNDKTVNHRLLHPDSGKKKTYVVQVEGEITESAIQTLQNGVEFKAKGKTYFSGSASCEKIKLPAWIWKRNPPVRERKNIPTSWIRLTITEGKNRQVRKMTAATGFPTLRLIRSDLAHLSLSHLKPGETRHLTPEEIKNL